MIKKKIHFTDGSEPLVIEVEDEEDVFYGINIARFHGNSFDRKSILYVETITECDED